MVLKLKLPSQILAFSLLLLVVVLVGVYLYLDRHNALSSIFRSWGIYGILLAIVLRGMLSTTPIPSEGLMVLYMKIYGVWFGVLYCWLGSIFGAFIVFALARQVGLPLIRSMITPARFQQVDAWISRRGTLGLIFVGLLPIPGFIVSYVLGTMPSVGLWTYVWTGAVSIIPYYVGSALIYLGITGHLYTWLGIGLVGFIILWLTARSMKKRWLAK